MFRPPVGSAPPEPLWENLNFIKVSKHNFQLVAISIAIYIRNKINKKKKYLYPFKVIFDIFIDKTIILFR